MARTDSAVGALDSRYFVTFSSIHRNASIELTTTTTRVTFCLWSGYPTDRVASTSHIKRRFECSGYHTVCARQWHGHSPCARLILQRLRFPEASNRGSNFIIFSCCIVIPVHSWGTIHRFSDRVLSLEITRVFVFQAQEFLPPDLTQVL